MCVCVCLDVCACLYVYIYIIYIPKCSVIIVSKLLLLQHKKSVGFIHVYRGEETVAESLHSNRKIDENLLYARRVGA